MEDVAEFVPVPSVVLDRLVALGVDVDRVLRAAGIARSRFQATRAKLSVHEFFAFWRALEIGGRDIGLRIGTRAEPHQLDVASLAAIHSDTLGDALAKFARYKRVVCGETISIDTVKSEARIRFHWLHASDEGLPMLLVDTTFASLVTLAAHGIGAQVRPLRVELARRRADAEMLESSFGCPIVFDMPADQLVLDAALLARPMVTRNADVVAMLVPALEGALAETKKTFADEARSVLGRLMTGERPSVEKVAHAMAMSPRTLQRRLGEHGTSYQALLDDVRREASRRLLAHTDLDANEIAFLLGYEELNSFARAFHAWEGATPKQWRQLQSH